MKQYNKVSLIWILILLGLLDSEDNGFWGAQAWLVRQAVRYQKEALQFTDERSKLEGELLNGIDVVKCNSWEVRALCQSPDWIGAMHYAASQFRYKKRWSCWH